METGTLDWVDSRYTTRSRSGAITVTTTAQGLPVAVRLTDSAMGLGADTLAARILALCGEGRIAAGVALREAVAAQGVGDEVLDMMGLATVEDLARAQSADDARACAPHSWLR